MIKEMHALEKQKKWDIVNLPTETHAIGYKWEYTLKYNPDGIIQRYKVRRVAKRFT